MTLTVTTGLMHSLIEEAGAAFPCECCGMLVGEDENITACIPARNVHSQSKTHFEIEPQALIDAHRAAREGGAAVVGYYHSHPSGPPEPSATDRASASGDGRVWAIVGEGEVRFWRDTKTGFEPLSYSLADR